MKCLTRTSRLRRHIATALLAHPNVRPLQLMPLLIAIASSPPACHRRARDDGSPPPMDAASRAGSMMRVLKLQALTLVEKILDEHIAGAVGVDAIRVAYCRGGVDGHVTDGRTRHPGEVDGPGGAVLQRHVDHLHGQRRSGQHQGQVSYAGRAPTCSMRG